MAKKKQPKKRSERSNKSQRSADMLERLAEANAMTIHVAGQNINIPMPEKDEFKKIAAHIRFLELCVTGITYKERRTIAKLQRRVGTLERMVEYRDAKLRVHKEVISQIKADFKVYEEHLKEQHANELARAKRITNEQKHEIEKEFIKNLQTSYEIQEENRKARDSGFRQGMNSSYRVYDSGTSDNRYYRLKF